MNRVQSTEQSRSSWIEILVHRLSNWLRVIAPGRIVRDGLRKNWSVSVIWVRIVSSIIWLNRNVTSYKSDLGYWYTPVYPWQHWDVWTTKCTLLIWKLRWSAYSWAKIYTSKQKKNWTTTKNWLTPLKKSYFCSTRTMTSFGAVAK